MLGVMGDFNNVLYTYEKIGGEMVHRKETQPFTDCLSISGFIDLKAKGCYFPWVKRGENGNRKSSNIDWALVNLEWMSILPGIIANFLPQGVSYHSPIIVEWSGTTNKFYPFRFNNS